MEKNKTSALHLPALTHTGKFFPLQALEPTVMGYEVYQRTTKTTNLVGLQLESIIDT